MHKRAKVPLDLKDPLGQKATGSFGSGLQKTRVRTTRVGELDTREDFLKLFDIWYPSSVVWTIMF